MTWSEGKYFNGTRGISYVLLYHPIALISNFCHAQDLYWALKYWIPSIGKGHIK